jgi:hypothetical protein
MGAPQYYALIVLIVVSTVLVLVIQHGAVAEFGAAAFEGVRRQALTFFCEAKLSI